MNQISDPSERLAIVVTPVVATANTAAVERRLDAFLAIGSGQELSQQASVLTGNESLLSMRYIRWIATIPFLALIIGPFFVNRVDPLILGLPFLLAWIVVWILITSLIMAVIYAADPANRGDEA